MVKPIWTWIMHDLSEYCHANFPNEKFGLMVDNASSHDLIEKLPYDNIQFIFLPTACTAYLQPADVLYNGVFKLKFKLLVEDFIINLYFDGKKIGCNDENAAKMASEAYYDTPKNIIKEWNIFCLLYTQIS